MVAIGCPDRQSERPLMDEPTLTYSFQPDPVVDVHGMNSDPQLRPFVHVEAGHAARIPHCLTTCQILEKDWVLAMGSRIAFALL